MTGQEGTGKGNMRERAHADGGGEMQEAQRSGEEKDEKKFKSFEDLKRAKQKSMSLMVVLGTATVILVLLLVGGVRERSHQEDLAARREKINQLGQRSLEYSSYAKQAIRSEIMSEHMPGWNTDGQHSLPDDELGMELVLKQLNRGSKVFEWGTGASAVYFAQCVKEWNIVIEDQQYCKDIASIAPINLKIHCFPVSKKTASDVRKQLQHIGQIDGLDLVLVDGIAADKALIPLLHMLKATSRALVVGFDPEETSPTVDRVQEAFRVKVTAPADSDGRGVSVLEVNTATKSNVAASAGLDQQDAGGEEEDQTAKGQTELASAAAGEESSGESPEDGKGAGADVFSRSREAARSGSRPAKKKSIFASMAAWSTDQRILSWKRSRRDQILSSPVPDQFGPREAYPCAAKCPNGNRPLENTVCPMMHPEEQELLLSALGPDTVVFEWGSGTSTLYYSQCVKNWTSIEHESEWCHLMQTLVPPNTRVICVPIEDWAKESFGSPGTWDGSKKEFKKYVESVHGVGCQGCLDVVLIDGRARGDCSIEVLPHVRPDSKVFIHDWMKARFGGTENYDKALDYYDIEKVVHVPPPQTWRSGSGLVMLNAKKDALAEAKAQYKAKVEAGSEDKGWFDALLGG